MSSSNAGRFRILALGGGGIKGTFTAAVLASWEKDILEPVRARFLNNVKAEPFVPLAKPGQQVLQA